MGLIMYRGISSQAFGIVVEHEPDYEMPKRDYEVIHVPGKNGDVVIDKGSFQNVNRTYALAVGDPDVDFTSLANRVSTWLNAGSGYSRLEDTYEPEYYRMALYQDEGAIENILSHAGRISVKFLCKPQRFLKTGEETSTYTFPDNAILNPTSFASYPCITVYGSGSGTLTLGDYIVSISSIRSKITINSEIQDIYNGAVNRNSDVALSRGFPKFAAGSNTLSFSGGITKVEVIPHWWTI